MINPIYLNSEVKEQMKQSFRENGMIKLPNFLTRDVHNKLLEDIKKQEGKGEKVPDRFSFRQYNQIKIVKDLSKQLSELISAIIGKTVKMQFNIRGYGHRDYTLIHDSELSGKKIEFFYVISPPWDSAWGGNKVYTGSDEPLVFAPEDNSFCLVDKRKDMNSFIQYINHRAGNNSYIILEGF
ncbi:hypothetical protein KW787_00445 [Candidatus Pacearchaeota archaeon]|nr:hypothetical protein [Candidatus Pacearchaeota archaeon]